MFLGSQGKENFDDYLKSLDTEKDDVDLYR